MTMMMKIDDNCTRNHFYQASVTYSSPGQGHCVVFLGKTLYSHSASLHPGVQMGTSKCAGGNPAMD